MLKQCFCSREASLLFTLQSQSGCNSTLTRKRLCGSLYSSQLLGTVGAVDVISVDHEALVGQREAAPLAVEAVLVPGVALIVHHVGAVAEPCRNGTMRESAVVR